MAEAGATKPEWVIEFGRAEWQSHLGGEFYEPECQGDIWYVWTGEGRCWCVLPPLRRGTDYALRLEAAPFIPVPGALYECMVETEGKRLARKVVPCQGEGELGRICFSPEETRRLLSRASGLELMVRKMPDPTLEIFANDMLLGRAGYEPKADMQPRDLVLRRELIAPQTVLHFVPQQASSIKDICGSGDERQMSFRFYRLLLSPL